MNLLATLREYVPGGDLTAIGSSWRPGVADRGPEAGLAPGRWLHPHRERVGVGSRIGAVAASRHNGLREDTGMWIQRRRCASRGFTLVELMIVVALIGVLASLAVPSFRNYQMTSKRAEAFGNLSSLAQTQKSYFAEFNRFVAAAPEPGATSGEAPSGAKRSVAPLSAAFAALGWSPEGDVFFDYDSSVPGVGDCNCTACFTATAYGNLDVAGGMSEITFFHPDATGGFCTVGVSGHGPPADPVTSEVIWDAPVRHPSSDFF